MKLPESVVVIQIRKRSSGHRIAVLTCDNRDHAFAIAPLIMASPMYRKCFISVVDWNGDEVGSFVPEGTESPSNATPLSYTEAQPEPVVVVYEAEFEEVEPPRVLLPSAARTSEHPSCAIIPFKR